MNESDWSNVVSTIQKAPPGAITQVEPVDGAEVTTPLPTFRWTASADPDVSDTLLYDLAWWVLVADSLVESGTAPDHADTFFTPGTALPSPSNVVWSVTARDPFGSTAAGADSGMTFSIIPEAPGLALGCLQNPVLTRYLDVLLAAADSLASLTVVRLEPAPPETLDVELLVAGTQPVYRGRHVLTGTGDVTLVAVAVDLFGQTTTDTLEFVSFEAARGGVIQSKDGLLTVAVEPGSVPEGTFLTLFGPDATESAWTVPASVRDRVAALSAGAAGGAYVAGAPSLDRRWSGIAPVPGAVNGWTSDVYEVGPAGLAAGGTEIRLDHRAAGYAGGESCRLVFETEGTGGWARAESFYDRQTPVLVTFPERLPGALRVIDVGECASSPLVRTLALLQNRPNPFNPSTTILYETPSAGWVSVQVFDLGGRLVRSLVDDSRPRGVHDVVWEGLDDGGRPVASGVYFYRIVHAGGVQTRKMVLLR
jgi:hypothetical protein